MSSADNLCNNFDLDQARQNFGPDLDPFCLTLRWYSWKIFFEKVDFEKTQHHEKFSAGIELILFVVFFSQKIKVSSLRNYTDSAELYAHALFCVHVGTPLSSFVDCFICVFHWHINLSVSCSLVVTCWERTRHFCMWRFLCICHVPIRCPGSGVVLDCIDCWSLPSSLLFFLLTQVPTRKKYRILCYSLQIVVGCPLGVPISYYCLTFVW